MGERGDGWNMGVEGGQVSVCRTSQGRKRRRRRRGKTKAYIYTGSGLCDKPIRSSSKCEAAAEDLDLAFDGDRAWSMKYLGCLQDDGGTVHYNYAGSEYAYGEQVQICIKARRRKRKERRRRLRKERKARRRKRKE